MLQQIRSFSISHSGDSKMVEELNRGKFLLYSLLYPGWVSSKYRNALRWWMLDNKFGYIALFLTTYCFFKIRTRNKCRCWCCYRYSYYLSFQGSLRVFLLWLLSLDKDDADEKLLITVPLSNNIPIIIPLYSSPCLIIVDIRKYTVSLIPNLLLFLSPSISWYKSKWLKSVFELMKCSLFNHDNKRSKRS